MQQIANFLRNGFRLIHRRVRQKQYELFTTEAAEMIGRTHGALQQRGDMPQRLISDRMPVRRTLLP